jgi:hypothetical protein
VYKFLQTTGWATFWAIFSQTHQGPMLGFFKFSPKKIAKKWRF